MTHFASDIVQDAKTGCGIVRLVGPGRKGQGETVAQFAPQQGSNLIGFSVDGTEYIFGMVPEAGAPLLGTPILYPTPNRVRNAQFSFGGHLFQFQPNNGTNFLHGLVRDKPWRVENPRVTDRSVSVKTWISFEPGTDIYSLFPIRNTLELVYTLEPGSIRFDFVVSNLDAEQLLPFGLAIHPFFSILGSRDSVRLLVPAQKWMEAEDLLPTGRLIDLEQGPADLSKPTSLDQLDLDDVFWGMTEDKPAVIYYDGLGQKLTLAASAFFTHTVVYTPTGRPFFCVENQSCSTDAHNLYGRGLKREARLALLKPGESLSAWVRFSVSEQ
jgi:aldose 1-epimerase